MPHRIFVIRMTSLWLLTEMIIYLVSTCLSYLMLLFLAGTHGSYTRIFLLQMIRLAIREDILYKSWSLNNLEGYYLLLATCEHFTQSSYFQ
jgi:hypothetical protein